MIGKQSLISGYCSSVLLIWSCHKQISLLLVFADLPNKSIGWAIVASPKSIQCSWNIVLWCSTSSYSLLCEGKLHKNVCSNLVFQRCCSLMTWEVCMDMLSTHSPSLFIGLWLTDLFLFFLNPLQLLRLILFQECDYWKKSGVRVHILSLCADSAFCVIFSARLLWTDGQSWVKKEYKGSPRTHPCGTPVFRMRVEDVCFF